MLIFLGILQGVSEFLPISSSGHLVLFSHIFKIDDSLFISIILHFATLLAIVFVFHKEIKDIILHPFCDEAMKIYLATIPTCLIVLVLMPLIGPSFEGKFLGVSFLISALLLFSVESFPKKNSQFNTKQAIIMGISQGFAIFPGISRSGTTISAGLLAGGDKEQCTKFSFLMSIPIIIMSTVLEVGKVVFGHGEISVNIIGTILSFIFAFVFGIISIKFMLKITKKSNLKWFSIYLILIAILSFIVL